MTFNEKLDAFKEYAKDKQVPEETRLKRLDICDRCDKKTVVLGIETCGECNCILALKTRMKTTSCPLVKW